jgi:proline iminopeptidase
MDGPLPAYFDTATWSRPDVISGGARMIPVRTPAGEFRVWTKRVGSNPQLKVLLLHGGPGATSELYECFDTWFPRAGLEYYYYDQLGSFRSDQPADPALWDLARFVDEVEQVRLALGLDRSNFVLLGQSWGGLLAMEYATAYQEHLKGLVISNMMSSARLYNDYATDVLMPAMDQAALAEIKRFEAGGNTSDPRYEQLLMEHHYRWHVCRMPLSEWPDPVSRSLAHINPAIYVPMQGPSELGLSGRLEGAGHRRGARHHGPRAHALDGRAATAGPVPALPGWRPPGPVRRSGALLPGPHRLSDVALNHAATSRLRLMVNGRLLAGPRPDQSGIEKHRPYRRH